MGTSGLRVKGPERESMSDGKAGCARKDARGEGGKGEDTERGVGREAVSLASTGCMDLAQPMEG